MATFIAPRNLPEDTGKEFEIRGKYNGLIYEVPLHIFWPPSLWRKEICAICMHLPLEFFALKRKRSRGYPHNGREPIPTSWYSGMPCIALDFCKGKCLAQDRSNTHTHYKLFGRYCPELWHVNNSPHFWGWEHAIFVAFSGQGWSLEWWV